MQKIAICDDDAEFCSNTAKCVRSFFSDVETDCIIRSFNDVSALDDSIKSGTEYDLLLLDIFFDDENGMSYAKEFRRNNQNTDIIFITTAKEYAIESFDVDPIYYILKPLGSDKLEEALNRYMKKHMMDNVCFTSSNGLIKVKLNEILYFEIYGHRIAIHKSNGTEVVLHGTLSEIENQLPRAPFVRPHRSYLVNMNYITEILRFDILLSNGEVIPISKSQFNRVQLRFLEFLDKKDIFG